MIKKILLPIFSALIFIIPTNVAAAEDFSQMNPTVKVTSYKKLFIDQVLSYGSGSGTVISADGVIVTNHHVIFDDTEFRPLDAFEVCITFDVQKEPVCKYTARLVAHDKDMDIALLKINSEDIFEKNVPDLNFMDYKSSSEPKEQTEIRVAGYPGSGGNTITITKGQISGFQKFNGYNYFKTDTDFDYGSSGGTALDSDGNYIGIPTYIRSYAENVGYFLDMREARDWIDENIAKKPIKNIKAENYLEMEMERFKKANDELKYEQADYPQIKVTLPKGWEFLEINDNSFFASQKNLSNPADFGVYVYDYQFEVDDKYMDKLDEELERVKKNYPDYKKENVKFNGIDAWKITYTSYSYKNTAYYIPYGYTLVGINYSVELNESEKQEKALKPAIDSISFGKKPVKNSLLESKFISDDPPFEISMSGDFQMRKNKDKNAESLISEAVQKDNFEGSFSISYTFTQKNERGLSAKERLDDIIKSMYGSKLIHKNDAVSLSGLTGFTYTYEYEGNKYQQMRKRMVMRLLNGEYEFLIHYDDLSEDFDENLPVIRTILDSFIFKGETEFDPSFYSYGDLGSTFNDIQFHRFAKAISSLAEKGVIKGYPDGSFRPEQMVSRTEALKMILESKNHLETKKGSKKVVDFSIYEKYEPSFKDIKSDDDLFKYVEYSRKKGFAEGYAGNVFKPHQKVNLVEALKLIMNAYEIPVWSGATEPWYKKYMDKGFELGLMPRGIDQPGQFLTRGELAYLVNSVYIDAE